MLRRSIENESESWETLWQRLDRALVILDAKSLGRFIAPRHAEYRQNTEAYHGLYDTKRKKRAIYSEKEHYIESESGIWPPGTE
jgi:hypothetical protein